MEKQNSFRPARMEKHPSFHGVIEKQQSFRGGVVMEKQKSFRGLMEKQKSFRIAMDRQLSFGGEKKRGKDSPGKRGDSPLHLAARAGNLTKLRDILQKCDGSVIKDLLSKQNQEGETALFVAAENGHACVVGELLKYIDVETAFIGANNGYDPFHVAAKQGHLGGFFLLYPLSNINSVSYSFYPFFSSYIWIICFSCGYFSIYSCLNLP